MLKFLKYLIILSVLLTAASGGLFYWLVSSPMTLKSEQVDFHIAPGNGMRTVARDIVGAGVDVNPWLLIALGKLKRVETSIKAGSYEIGRGITALELLDKLTRGDVTQTEIVFIEGWTFRQMRERLDAHPDICLLYTSRCV